MLEQMPAADTVTGIGGTGLAAFAVWRLSQFVTTVTTFLDAMKDHMRAEEKHREAEAAAWTRAADHHAQEERFHRRIEGRIGDLLPAGE